MKPHAEFYAARAPEPQDEVVLPRAVVRSTVLQPEDLGVLALLLLIEPGTSMTVEGLATEFTELGWAMPPERFRLIVDRLTTAGHVTQGPSPDTTGLPALLVWRTPRSADAVPREARPASAVSTQPKTSWTYAVQVVDSHHVKIGKSDDPRGRFKTLSNASPSPLELIWTAEGGAALEAFLHQQFAGRRVRGEWFDFAGVDAVALIREAASGFEGAR